MNPTPTDRQRAIWRYLHAHHRGRHAGIHRQDLADHLALPERALRAAIAALVLQGVPIGSHPRYGLYVCEEAEDYTVALQCLGQESYPTLARMRALERAQKKHDATVAREPFQLEMFGEG